MNESELNSKVFQKIKEFESIEDIFPSSEWNQELMRKLDSSSQFSSKTFPVAKYTFLIIFFILINVGFIITMMNKNTQSSNDRSQELQEISKEFLINPNSINNQ
jgi:hypothetical protein